MKVKILAIALVLSFALNIAGVVFFILYLNSCKHLRAVKREKANIEGQLALVRSSSVIGEALGSEKIFKRLFVSEPDGQMDWYAFQPPRYLQGETDYTLVLYLHGMGSNYLEPFVNPPERCVGDAIFQSVSNVGILSCNYRRESSWGNDLAMSDISQNVRQVLNEYPFRRIVVMGTSMGGCMALTYAATAPQDIKKLIKGVVSMESAGDLLELYNRSSHAGLRPAMIVAFAGMPNQKPEVYRSKSFLTNLDSVTPGTSFYIVGARNDTIVPFDLQQKLADQLSLRKFPTKFEAIEGKHQFPPSQLYVDGLKFVLSGQQP